MGSGVLKPDMPGPILFDPGFLWSTINDVGENDPRSRTRFRNNFLIDIVNPLKNSFVFHPDPWQDRDWCREPIAV